jgi:hypothetical protein
VPDWMRLLRARRARLASATSGVSRFHINTKLEPTLAVASQYYY